jgi:hypothetical protein
MDDSKTKSRIGAPFSWAIALAKVGNWVADSMPVEVSSNHRIASRAAGFPSTIPTRMDTDFKGGSDMDEIRAKRNGVGFEAIPIPSEALSPNQGCPPSKHQRASNACYPNHRDSTQFEFDRRRGLTCREWAGSELFEIVTPETRS